MLDEIEILKRRLQREKSIRRQAERIAEEKSRELYIKGLELEKALKDESRVRKEFESLYQKFERLARVDPLTNLNNRRSFSADARRLFHIAIRHGKELTCAMLDIDFFKSINDNYGHYLGDRVLVAVAKTCRHRMRQTDLLARFGGEEFSFLFPETGLDAAAVLMEQIRAKISDIEFRSGDDTFSITVSIGVTSLLETDDDVELMLRRSDDALYDAKKNGRNRIVIWKAQDAY